jgi:catechol 2,3-dioxygenase
VWSYPGALFLSAGGYHHHLGTNVWASGATPAEPDEVRLLTWEMVLPTADDVAAAAQSLSSAGCQVEWTRDRAVVAQDPWQTALHIHHA